MTQNTTQKQPAQQQPAPKKPNETGSVSVEGFVRIFDPVNKEVFVEKRA
ncbi:hypothetical protein UFOVP328_224 [uncultured Caudovirales phage]|uniref:Uncharacterized protein n=1 Tax=uncultured Caudovirales phage TaxID=2100421 RepID=A0A6J5LV91_9CAUD|nr:hypothetical protein UFOVP328_224 [uncultured Caudovirales phage]